MSLIARLAPRVNETGGVDLDATHELGMVTIVGDVRAALDRARAGTASFEDLENPCLGEGRHDQGAVVYGAFAVDLAGMTCGETRLGVPGAHRAASAKAR
jgi:hypothetical protein